MGILSSIGNKIKSAVQSIVHPSSTSKSGSTSSTSSASTPVYEKTNEDTLQEYNGTDMDSGSYADESTTSSGSISGFFKKAWNTVKKGAEKVADFFGGNSKKDTTTNEDEPLYSNATGSYGNGLKDEKGNSSIKGFFQNIWSNITNGVGKIIDYFDKDTKDGEIGETKQNLTGDCWLLSGVNALSYTEKGREIIKNALEYCEDGSVRVHLKGVGEFYTITQDEIASTKGSLQYSSGDDDMIAIELAVEKALDDVANGKIAIDSSAPWFLTGDIVNETKFHKSSAEGGWTNELFYFLTGKEGRHYSYNEPDKQNMVLDMFMRNDNKEFVMGASSKEEAKVKDVNGETVKLVHPHAYAVKKVDDDTVTVINPWNSGKDIVLPRETFMENFSVDFCNLSDYTPNPEYTSKTYTVNKSGYKIYRFEHRGDIPSNDYGVTYDYTEEIYSPDGTKLKSVSKDMFGRLGQVIEYNPDGTKKSDNIYGSDGLVKYSEEYNENGEPQNNIYYHSNSQPSCIYEYENGKIKSGTGYYENGSLSFVTEYNKKGKPTKRTLYDEYGNITRLIEFDENGNEIK